MNETLSRNKSNWLYGKCGAAFCFYSTAERDIFLKVLKLMDLKAIYPVKWAESNLENDPSAFTWYWVGLSAKFNKRDVYTNDYLHGIGHGIKETITYFRDREFINVK